MKMFTSWTADHAAFVIRRLAQETTLHIAKMLGNLKTNTLVFSNSTELMVCVCGYINSIFAISTVNSQQIFIKFGFLESARNSSGLDKKIPIKFRIREKPDFLCSPSLIVWSPLREQLEFFIRNYYYSQKCPEIRLWLDTAIASSRLRVVIKR